MTLWYTIDAFVQRQYASMRLDTGIRFTKLSFSSAWSSNNRGTHKSRHPVNLQTRNGARVHIRKSRVADILSLLLYLRAIASSIWNHNRFTIEYLSKEEIASYWRNADSYRGRNYQSHIDTGRSTTTHECVPAQSSSRAYLPTVNKGHAIFIDRADNIVSNAGINNLKLHYSSPLARIGWLWTSEIKCGVATFRRWAQKYENVTRIRLVKGQRENSLDCELAIKLWRRAKVSLWRKRLLKRPGGGGNFVTVWRKIRVWCS